MSQDWADKIAQQLLGRNLIQSGICLVLGAADSGKTTLVSELAKRLARTQPVGIVDADIGQSHIGPPTTVGWSIVDSPQFDFSTLPLGGISFVGDITPSLHLLQLTAAVVQSVGQVSASVKLIIIDTPGFISGPAASALWWTVQRILQPKLILAVQRNDELKDIFFGLCSFDLQLELVKSDPQIPTKSLQHRQNYRQDQFKRYFQNSCLYDINLSDVSVQASQNFNRTGLIHRVVALRDAKGFDMAIALITNWPENRNIVTVKSPKINIRQVRCLVIGDVTVDITDV